MIYLSNSPNNKDRALHKGKQSKITSLQERLSVLAVKGILGNSLSQKRGVPLIISGQGGLIFFFGGEITGFLGGKGMESVLPSRVRRGDYRKIDRH